MSDDNKESEQWGIIDLFGHQRLAGKISEQPFGGDSFVRVDIPAVEGEPAHTRLFGKGAIYSISFTSQAIAEGVARQKRSKPVQSYEFDSDTQTRMRALPVRVDNNIDSVHDDDFDDIHESETGMFGSDIG